MKWIWGVYVVALIASIWVGAAWPFLIAVGVHVAAAVRHKQDNAWQQRRYEQISFASRLSSYKSAVEEHDNNVNNLTSSLEVLGGIVDDHQTSWREALALDLPPIRVCECGRDAELRSIDALSHRVEQDHHEGRTIRAEMANAVATLTNSWADHKKRLLENVQRGTEMSTEAVAAIDRRDREAWEPTRQAMATWQEAGIQDTTEETAFLDTVDAYNRALTWATNRLQPTIDVVYPCQECIRRQAEAADRQQRELIAQTQLEHQQQVAEQQLAEQRQLLHQQERLAKQRTKQQQALFHEIARLRNVQERRARQKR